ncbi:copper homeostasis protein CutC [Adhaeribacter aquaticus]|uniref:copper homeostasis protein CutC n=1 Tax=Adhaeribacter aquaticus TaxID=299567 RepID=UPI00047C0004|nr:copper homeostasis protein CutC [Adhaeribacter aquaticus]
MQYKLEICVSSMPSALKAQKGGADRIELCDNMAEGGTTPSFGLIKVCKEKLTIPVFPIIRPRGGNFVYTAEEFEVMQTDILACKSLGCEGVVLGLLNLNKTIDTERCAALIALARPMQVTFHRAFDACHNLEKALEAIISLGCERVLTSGGEAYAAQGLSKIEALVKRAKDRLVVMPGSGINVNNLADIVLQSGATEFHSTAKTTLPAALTPPKLFSDSPLLQTNSKQVKEMKNILLSLGPS